MVSIEKKLVTNKFSRPRSKMAAVKGVIVHWTANAGATADNHYRFFEHNNNRYAGAHYFVDKNKIVQLIPENETTYHANETGYSKIGKFEGYKSSDGYRGNANSCTIGVEMCVERNGTIHANTIKQTIELIKDINRRHNLSVDDVYRHFDVTGKLCPKPFVNDQLSYQNFKRALGQRTATTRKVVKQAKPVKVKETSIVDWLNAHGQDSSFASRSKLAREYGIANYRGTASQNVRLLKLIRKGVPKKASVNIDKMAQDVIDGKYGSGVQRRKALGSYYSRVQKRVNEILTGKMSVKSYTVIAREVIEGKWGTGHARKNALRKAGYDYRKVQDLVNKML